MNGTTEWAIPKIEGVHVVARHGDSYALQFPAGCEEEVLEHFRSWIHDLEETDHAEAAELAAEIQAAPPPGLPPRNRRRQIVPAHHPRTLDRTATGNTADPSASASTTGRPRTLAEAQAMALGQSPSDAGAASAVPSLKNARPQMLRRATGTVMTNQPKGNPLTPAQVEAWNAQQAEGMALFQQLKRAKKPTEKAPTIEEVNAFLKEQIEARGGRFLRSPDDAGEVLEGEIISQDIQVVAASPEVVAEIVTTQEGPLTPNRTPVMTEERRWNAQQDEREAIAKELKARWPQIAITMPMVIAEQEARAKKRGEVLIPIVAPGKKGGLVASLGVEPEKKAEEKAPAAEQIQFAPTVIGNVMQTQSGEPAQSIANGSTPHIPATPEAKA